MPKPRTLGSWLKGFFVEYLPCDRGLSINTQRSYRDCFRMFLVYVSKAAKKPVDRLTLEDLTQKRVRGFLRYLETHRGCSPQSRNQRLAAIRAFGRYLARDDPAYLEWWVGLRAIELKKTTPPKVQPLTKEEMNAMLEVPDRAKPLGRTEHALLLFFYNTGARVTEAVQVTVGDLDFRVDSGRKSVVKLRVKGGKPCVVPMWKETESVLRELVEGRAASDAVFLSSHRAAYTRSGIYRVVERNAAEVPGLKAKVTPHVLRHSSACLLLQSGVDIVTISHWLGHASVKTTQRYLQIDLKKKQEAAEQSDVLDPGEQPAWKQQPGVMAMLDSL